MLKKIATAFLLLSSIFSESAAQDTQKIDWEKNPVLKPVPVLYAHEPAVILKEYSYVDLKDVDDKVWMYVTTHRLVKVLDEKGIEGFNKMNLPVYAGMSIETLKARTILPDGKTLEITPDKLKESKGEDGASEIVFAMEGVEKNAEVELIVCYKKPYALFGQEIFQYSVPVLSAKFQLSSPKRIQYEGKGFNGFSDVHDTLIGDTRYLTAYKDSIPALATEPYSFLELNRMRVEYKISHLPDTKENVRVFTWKDLAKRLYENYYQPTEKEIKAVNKFLGALGVNDNDKEIDKIKKIETGIKTKITYYKELSDEDGWKLDRIISSNSATETGLVRLFACCFTQAGVKHELGITTNRYQHLFEADFENWNTMENYVYYFPNLKNFLSPGAIYYRYPFLPVDVINNKGVFCKLVTLGDVTNAIADIVYIPATPLAENQNNIDATITISANMDSKVDISYSFSGYTAMGVREAIVLLPKDKSKELAEKIISITEKPENIEKYTVVNEGFENYYDNKPLEIKATVKAPELIEKAGAKYLFKIGDVIGRQSELYQNSNRKLPIDLDYPHYLNRKITVILPDGYSILNPETIKIQTELKNTEGKATAAFYADYKMEGNKLIVTISEFYNQLHYPISDYEAFRKVINAAADFNKVTLLLSKQ